MMSSHHPDLFEEQKFIFASLFLLANKLQVIGDQYLRKDGLTTKQWFLTAMILQFGSPPTLSEVSDLMGSSRQNVKQLALKLEEKNFLKIEKDEQDTRAVRLKLTEQCRAFWEERQIQDDQFIRELFGSLSEMETKMVGDGLKKLLQKIAEIEAR